MTVALWLGTYLLHSTVLCGAAVLLRARLRRVEGAEWIWRTALFLPVVTATAMAFTGGGLWTIDVAAVPGGIAGSPGAREIDLLSLLTAAWMVIAALLILRDWLAHRWFMRGLGTRFPADAVFVALLSDVLRRTRLRRSIRLTCSATAASPSALGRSEICLSTRAMCDLGSAELRALLAHEVAHIARRDGWWFAATACVESAFFFQPLNRLARRELRHLAETACDDWAARTVCDPVAMAHCLVEVAAWSRTARPATVPAVAGASDLSDRVLRLLEAPRPLLRISRVSLLGVVFLFSLALPCLGVSPVTLPARFANESAEFKAGFEAGRRFAAGLPDASSGARTGNAPSPRLHSASWRADLERELQARRR